ncbi:thioesterase II family protein [Streptomyces sp. UNOC14_S4]|uniref:thioesterase II family protein n=1 Tax=Streptomyces sp. UNOC14_S4 TaxID=2872340 RepID=UPI001E3C068E|nr:alpha/beta fold hydrolase [Streptomyces sp. UNOC14_S4]MCC3766869.1 alpha/beta fold hydrolase [Streptomyces sp. UNOC14_S4]
MAELRENSAWVRRFHPSPESSVRLVCLPHAGGSASFYFPMSQALSPAVDVLCLQYPGRQERRQEPGIENIPDYADAIAAELKPWLDVPTAFFGHSMGAILAYEVALRLEREGAGPVALFASGRRAPSRYREENVHRRDDDGIVREMQLLSGTDARVLGDEEILRMVLPAIRSDYTAIETYRSEPGAAVRAPITVFTGDRDPRTSLEEAEAWRAHTEGEFDIQVFPGGHFFLANHSAKIIEIVSAKTSAVGSQRH